MPSKCFGPTDTGADTLTQIGTDYQMPPGDWVITDMRIGKGNVTDAAENAGYLHIATVERNYDFAYGNGCGAATNSGANQPAEKIQCAIHVPGSSILKVYILDGFAAKEAEVSVHFVPGGANNFRTYAAGGVTANGDTVAATEESMTVLAKLTGATLTPVADASIRQIRFAGSGVVDALSGTGKLEIQVPGDAGPYEYAVGNGPGGDSLGATSNADVIDIPEGILIRANATITVKITTVNAMKAPVMTMSCW